MCSGCSFEDDRIAHCWGCGVTHHTCVEPTGKTTDDLCDFCVVSFEQDVEDLVLSNTWVPLIEAAEKEGRVNADLPNIYELAS